MPEYGWNLFNQESLGGKEYNLSEVSSTCSTCPKISLENKEVATYVKRTGVILEFKQEDKVCSVTISKMENPSPSQARGLTSLGLGDTIIMVVYENK